MTVWTVVPSPIDDLLLAGNGVALTRIDFSPHRPVVGERDDRDPVLVETRAQLEAYFAGDRQVFDMPLAPAGSPFQTSVWRALRDIPFGATVTYGDIARRLGLDPATTSRAVGTANGSNPIPVVIPCHRVIGANGSLTGFGGGLARKRLLLDLEQQTLF